ncbi:MAG: hypothetical protein QME12_09080 [Nanoarchaeota archaeon]|nr:hypothetical protein [Nanoarchaeota archaeon]
MGNFEKHIEIAKEKLRAEISAYQNNQHTVVGDLAVKIVEQLVEADASTQGKHFGEHSSRHEFSNQNYPKEINNAMRKVWFAYGDLGYDGANGKRAKAVMENLKAIVLFFEKRIGVKIWAE